MPHFSRLTDIVTCNLTALLQAAADPRAALDEIVREMRDGVAGAQRSAATAARNVERIEIEVSEQRRQVDAFLQEAREHLAQHDDDAARAAIARKREAEALVVGLAQQLQAAEVTRNHLQTTLAALRARLSDAERRQAELPGPGAPPAEPRTPTRTAEFTRVERVEIDRELDELRRELGGP
jgi:phage shock protein A